MIASSVALHFIGFTSLAISPIISANLGDYSDFVEAHHCGLKLNGKSPIINKPDKEEKKRMKELVLQYFTKEANLKNIV